MKFVELHLDSDSDYGVPIMINVDHVTSITANDPDEGGSVIYTVGASESYTVRERYEDLQKLFCR